MSLPIEMDPMLRILYKNLNHWGCLGWLRGTVVERRSFAGERFLSCA